jgi:DnaJ-class molecular chaperone
MAKCPRRNGNDKVACPRFKGKAVEIVLVVATQDCPKCYGKGEVHCPRCGGTGKA